MVKKLGRGGLWTTATGLPRYRLNLYDPRDRRHRYSRGAAGTWHRDHALTAPQSGEQSHHRSGRQWSLPVIRRSSVISRKISPSRRAAGRATFLSASATRASRSWHAADAYFRGFETNGTPQYIAAPLLPETDRRRERHPLHQHEDRQFDAVDGRARVSMAATSRACRCVTGAIRWWTWKPGAVMSLVRFGDPMGKLSKASLPMDKNGKPQQGPDIMVGASFVQRDLPGVAGQDRRHQCFLDSFRGEPAHAMAGRLGAHTGLVSENH